MADNIQDPNDDPNDVRRGQNPQQPGSTQGQPGGERPEGTTGREERFPGQGGPEGQNQPGEERPRDPNRRDRDDEDEGGFGGGGGIANE